MRSLKTSVLNLFMKISLVLALITPSGAFELFKEGGAISQSELMDVKASGFWVYINILFWPLALIAPLYLLVARGTVAHVRLWCNGPGIRIVLVVLALSTFQLIAGTPFYSGSFRAIVSLLLTTLVLATAVNYFSTSDLLKTLNRLYFGCFAFSLFLVFLVPSYGLSADHDGAWQGMFFHKNALGTFCATYAVLMLAAWRGSRALTFVNLIASAILIIKSGSYTAIAAYMISFLLMLSPVRIRRTIMRFKGPLVGASFVASLSIVALSVLSFKLKILDKDFTFSDRNLIWGLSLLRFSSAPVIGKGINSLGYQVAGGDMSLYHATGQMLTSHHNGFIAALYDFGIVGVVPLLLVFVQALRRIHGYGVIQYAYLAIFLSAIVMNTFEERFISFNLFLLVFLLFSYLNEKERTQGPSFAGSLPAVSAAVPVGLN